MPSRNVRSRLVELGNSGYEIVADEPDIRKWKVTNADRKLLGVVDELLVDRELHKVRYIVLGLHGKPLNLLSRRVLIPIGIAELDQVDDLVVLPSITLEHLATLPTYRKGKLNLESERKIRAVFSPAAAAMDVDDNVFYEHEQFSDRGLHNRKKKLESSRRDNVVYKDDPVYDRRPNEEFRPFKEGTVEVTEKSEVPVVTKEPRIVEEVSVNKQVRDRDETVQDSVRRTEVEVEKLKDEPRDL